jgi:hypothetical protein
MYIYRIAELRVIIYNASDLDRRVNCTFGLRECRLESAPWVSQRYGGVLCDPWMTRSTTCTDTCMWNIKWTHLTISAVLFRLLLIYKVIDRKKSLWNRNDVRSTLIRAMTDVSSTLQWPNSVSALGQSWFSLLNAIGKHCNNPLWNFFFQSALKFEPQRILNFFFRLP